ncbi:MAG: hypothetical protein GY722_15455 [bacterium]|nr:hypothetical protein [bacterium]
MMTALSAASLALLASPALAQSGMQTLWITRNDDLYRVDGYAGGTPSVQLVGGMSNYLSDIAVHPIDGRLFGIHGAFPASRLYEIDRNTAALTLIADIPVGACPALDFDRFGVLYARSRTRHLYQLDPETGASTLVGWTGERPEGDIAFDVDGSILGSIDGRRLDRVDPATGQSTVLGTMAVSTLVHGLEVDCDGRVYAFAADGDVFEVDPSTAGVTLLYNLSISVGVSGAAFDLATPCSPGVPHCSPAVPNSTGSPAMILPAGSVFVIDNDFTLTATNLPPGEFGYFLLGSNQGSFQPPGSQGILCLACGFQGCAGIGRFNRANEIVQGPMGSLVVDLTAVPLSPPAAVQPGETWNFQCWYRDLGSSNFTDAVSVSFL